MLRRAHTPITFVIMGSLAITPALAQGPVGTAFTYQGQLKDGGAPANGSYDFQFTLYDDVGAVVGGPVDLEDQPVVKGLFSVVLDFGSSAFNGDTRFLEIGVRPGDSGGAFTPLSPWQELTPTPYATTALQTLGVDGHSLDAVDGSPTDAVLIDADGKVRMEEGGLLVFDAVGQGIWLTSDSFQFDEGTSEDPVYRYSSTNDTHEFWTDGSRRMVITANGRVGIGTATPGTPLHVTSASGETAITGENPSESTRGELGSEYGGVYAWAGVPGGFAGYFDGSGYFRDNVGIGTTSPGSPLTVAGLVESTASGFKFPDGTIQSTAATGGGDCLWNLSGSDIYYDAGNVGIGTQTPNYRLHVTDTGGATAIAGENAGEYNYGYLGHEFAGVYASNNAPYADGKAIYGIATGPDGFGGYFEGRGYFSGNVGIGTTSPQYPLHVASTSRYAVYGETDYSNGRGVQGVATHATGIASGVVGVSNSTSGRGVFGAANSATGSTAGVLGEVYSPDGYGVRGYNDADTGNYTAIGVYGSTAAPRGVGVKGYAPGPDGGYGLWGQANGTSGRGVFAEATAESGTAIGLEAYAASPSGYAVNAFNEAESGNAIAIRGDTASPDGFGGYFNGKGYFSGNVGVGTTSPGSPLTVAGLVESTADGFKFPDGTIQTTAASGGGDSFWQEATNGIYYPDGNVGLGLVTNPSYLIHATGDDSVTVVDITNNFEGPGGNAIMGDTYATDASALFGRNWATSAGSHGVNGITYSPDGDGVRGRNLATSGDAPGVHGLSSSTEGMGVYGHATSNTGTTYGVYGEVSSADGFGGYFNGMGYFSGKVGIGTSSPQTALHVVGDPTLGSLLVAPNEPTSDANCEILLAEDDDYTFGMSIEYDGNSNQILICGKRDSDSFGPHLSIHRDNGNVGINTTNPGADLDVAGSFRTDSFRLDDSPASGYVLTCDSLGNGTWQEPASGFDLPYEGTVSSDGPALKITNSGSDPNSCGAWFESGAEFGEGLYGVATGYYATAIKAEASGHDATAFSAYATGLNGVAVSAKTESSSAPAIAARNYGGGPLIQARNAPSNTVFEVANDGTTSVNVLHIVGGSDLAERFDVSDGRAKPGMVVEIDPENAGKLRVARGVYNRRVAGVISGANELAVGMLLADLPGSENSQPIALSGRVWVHCDATAQAITPGDMLTTSERAGHAMAVTDFERAHGAVIGKAMTSLDQGQTGMVLVLVNLQ